MEKEVAHHYMGENGQKYFEAQNTRIGNLGGQLNARKFAPYVKPDDKVLDFGCGGGWLLKHLVCSGRFGVEPNVSAHEVCKLNGVEVYRTLDCLDGKFDIIISHHCLEHVPSPIGVLAQLSRCLEENGRLVVVLPLDDWRTQKNINVADMHHHLHTWTPVLLKNTLEEGGFLTESVQLLTHAWPPGFKRLHRLLPIQAFDLLCKVFAVLRKRRQLVAVARAAQ
jgi:2-polyprenyl-3-methyl-5-hydroxy-6-metoxy-1,4-benzoquinol methylase